MVPGSDALARPFAEAIASEAPGAPFDAVAADYDARFSHDPIGRALREAVWFHLADWVRPGVRILDIGCGTGEDALHLAGHGASVVGIDASAAMVRVARAKLAGAGLGTRAAILHLAAQDLEDLERAVADAFPNDRMGRDGALDNAFDGAIDGTFDLALADFGALNCLSPAEVDRLGRDLGARVRPGGRFAAVVMGPACAWETAWFVARGDVRRAFRRWRRRAVADLGSGPLAVFYPTVADLAAALTPLWRLERRAAVGSALPPTFAGAWLARRPRALAAVAWLDRRVSGWRPAVALADHYLACFVRTGSPTAAPDGLASL